jgi:hypothetical protein
MSMAAKADTAQSKKGNACPTASRFLQNVFFSQDRDFGDECSTQHAAVEAPHTLKVAEEMPPRRLATNRPWSTSFMQDRDTGDETRHGMNG